MATGAASAYAFRQHVQTAAALGAGMPYQHCAVEELTGALLEYPNDISQSERQRDDVHSSGRGAEVWLSSLSSAIGIGASSMAFWFFGVNFFPQVLHSRMRRRPMVFVRR